MSNPAATRNEMKNKSDGNDVDQGLRVEYASAKKQPMDKDMTFTQLYDLSHVMSPVQDSRGRLDPSYSIDPWEVGVSPTSQTSQSISESASKRQRVVIDRTVANDDGLESIVSNHMAPSIDSETDGYDPDDDDDDEYMMSAVSSRDIDAPDGNSNGVARTSIPANRFLVPSDIHPNMEQREEDIAQLRLLAGKLSADWKGQDFMAPALAR
jgi:hypothetical protein